MPGRALDLIGRAHECGQIDRLVEAARDNHSGVLVLGGDAGIGKSALLESRARTGLALRSLRRART
jgi:hypothetical protein